MGRDFNKPAHFVEKVDPKVDGPYLDDIREDQERAYRESREKRLAAQENAEVVELPEIEVEAEGSSEVENAVPESAPVAAFEENDDDDSAE